jgi:polar amino acid transport system substrate-binding protein
MPATPPARRRALTGVAALAMAAALLTGCVTDGGDRPSMATPQATAADPKLVAKVPAAIRAAGKLVVGTDATYAPSEFLDKDNKTIIGFDVDMFNAVAAKLGLSTQWQTAKFDEIIPGVQSGKYHVGVSSFSITNERLQKVAMVSYFKAGTQWAAKAGSKITPDTTCGKKVAVQIGTVQISDVQSRSTRCVDSGKAPIRIHQYQAQSDATAAVLSGKDDAMLADSPVCAYAVKQREGQLALIGIIYDSAPYGYVLQRGQPEFAEAVSRAVNLLIVNGTYRAIAAKWGLGAGGIMSSSVNPVL